MKLFVARKEPETLKDYFAMLDRCNIAYDYGVEADDISQYDGLLLPGGIDIDPAFYNQEKDSSVKECDSRLDQLQMNLLKTFLSQNKKVLGICRGLQLINVYFKGSLIQDVKTAICHHGINYERKYHLIENSSFMEELYGKTTIVNSFHHQAIDRLADGFAVVSKSEDGIIEAIRHQQLPIIAVQFHPEMPVEQDEIDGIKLFNYFKQL